MAEKHYHSHFIRSYSCTNAAGDYNLLFTFEYGWQGKIVPQRSFVVLEKTLKANLLGSDNVAGIPVGLAGFIVPGLFFWLIVALLKVPWLPWKSNELALGDRLIYSVLISILIVVVGGRFKLTDISAGLGLAKLGHLALLGALLGTVIGGLDRLFRLLIGRRRKRQEEEATKRLIKFGDTQEMLLDKLLDTSPAAIRPKAIVSLKNGKEFRGSLARKDKEATALVGWFQVSLDGQPKDVADQFKKLVEMRCWREALTLASSRNLNIEVRDTIYDITAGTNEPQEYAHHTWLNTDVKGVTNSDNEGEMELITLQ